MKPHKHAELIKQWADGAQIDYKNYDGYWEHIEIPSWDEETDYLIKPELEYPKSGLSDDEINGMLKQNRFLCESSAMARIIADAAVKKYIQENEE